MIDIQTIFNIKTDDDFKDAALRMFKHQFENNRVYRSFCDLLYKHPSEVKALNDIPFLPIQFFKTRNVVSTNAPIETIFTSSGTTGNIPSKHLVADLNIYNKSFSKAFEHFYGDIKDYVVLALLPSYLERDDSSLIYMVNAFINASNYPESGFYLNNLSELKNQLVKSDSEGKKVLLIGVSFALLDLVETYKFKLKNTVVMETGGMKGRRKEMIRAELHQKLQNGFGIPKIHSEYGMTELLSQAYSKGKGVFECPPWMKVLTRDTEDALTIHMSRKAGGINIIDLANVNSCSFIATQDLGRINPNGSFEVVGRFDNSDVRGCNLMML